MLPSTVVFFFFFLFGLDEDVALRPARYGMQCACHMFSVYVFHKFGSLELLMVDSFTGAQDSSYKMCGGYNGEKRHEYNRHRAT